MKLDDHFFIEASDQINDLIKPLKGHFEIEGLIYKKTLKNGQAIRLSTNRNHSICYLENAHYKTCPLEFAPHEYRAGVATWQELFTGDTQTLQEIASQYKMDHGMVLTIPSKDFVEHLSIGVSKQNPQALLKIFSNLDLIERFFLYFKDRAQKLLLEAEKHTIPLMGNKEKIAIPEGVDIFLENHANKEEFLKQIPFSTMTMKNNAVLSTREIEVGLLIIQGMTSKEIGSHLFLSPRTIETHAINIKNKLDVNTKSELIAALIENGFRTNGRIAVI